MYANSDPTFEVAFPIISIKKLSVCFLSSSLKTYDSYNDRCYFVFAQSDCDVCSLKIKYLFPKSVRFQTSVWDAFKVENILFIFKHKTEDWKKNLENTVFLYRHKRYKKYVDNISSRDIHIFRLYILKSR